MKNYKEFLNTKQITAPSRSIALRKPLNTALFPFQKAIVEWALRKGKAAIFADCGLGKTIMQLAWADQIDGKVLIVAPLAVVAQTIEEGARFGIKVTSARSASDVKAEGIYITNYEMVDYFTMIGWDAVILDESSILKNLDGKWRNLIIDGFEHTPYKLACTATPAPNDFMEMGNHAEFLNVLTHAEMLSTFFVHDGGEVQKWRLKGHAEKDFWKWICSWAINIKKPSDIGFSDEGYNLPKLNIEEVVVKAQGVLDGYLFPMMASSLQERLQARRETINERIGAAWAIVRRKPKEQWLVWCNLNAESNGVAKELKAIEVQGSDKPEVKAANMLKFAHGEIPHLVTKPSIAGFGVNWQNCHNVIFLGLSDSYEEFYQAVRRCWRFGQTKEVNVYVVMADIEGAVLKNIKRKEKEAEKLTDEMVKNMSDITKAELKKESLSKVDYVEAKQTGKGWEMHLGDCVELTRHLKDESIDYSIFSPPFASLYTYSASDRDMGNCRDTDTFYQHFTFFIKELFRVLASGRLVSFHCMNLPTSKTHDGVIGIRDFRGELIRMFIAEGFIYHSEVCIWKDPVTAMQRTKALGLLHKQLKKDSAMSRQGIPDYLVTMRKPGQNKKRISHTDESFPVREWQNYASPIWMDINPSDTLQFRSAREHQDEKHICPLQLEVIRRALRMWATKDDVVLSPFAGIGSEGYEALKHGCKFIGFELKKSYYEQACRNLKSVEVGNMPLFNNEATLTTQIGAS